MNFDFDKKVATRIILEKVNESRLISLVPEEIYLDTIISINNINYQIDDHMLFEIIHNLKSLGIIDFKEIESDSDNRLFEVSIDSIWKLSDMISKLDKYGFDMQAVQKSYEKKSNKERNKFPKKKIKSVSFDDEKGILTVNDKECQLPFQKNEHILYRSISNIQKKELVSWDIAFEEMTGSEPENQERDQKMIRDTIDRLNERVMNILNTEDKILEWDNKNIRRLH